MIVNKTVWNAVLACNLNYDIMIAAHFQAKPLTSTVIQVYALDSNAKEAEVEWFSEDVQGLLELRSRKMSFSLYWTGMQKWEVEISGLTGKFGVKSTKWSREKGNRVLLREHTGHSKHPLPITQVKSLHMDITKCPWKTLHMDNTKIRLIIFFAAKDGEALYSQQKQDWVLTVAQIMNSLLPNSYLNWRKMWKPLDIQAWPKSNPLQLEWKRQIDSRDLIRQNAWRTMDSGSWLCTVGRDLNHPQ